MMSIQPKTIGMISIIGGVLVVALQLGLFVTRSDLQQLETKVYMTFETKDEINSKLNNIDSKVDRLTDLLLEERKK